MDKLCFEVTVSYERYRSELLQGALSATHSLLKHELKTAILAQIRLFEYLIPKIKNVKPQEFFDLMNLSYETSLNQYDIVSRKIEQLKNILTVLPL